MEQSVPALLQLHICEGPVSGKKLLNDKQLCTIGRTKKSMLQIKDPAVSEKHAELRWDPTLNHWEMRDVGSSNGTKVNDVALTEGEWTALQDGDVILFGSASVVRVEIALPSVSPREEQDIENIVPPLDQETNEAVVSHTLVAPSPTVEQFLEDEVHYLEQKIKMKSQHMVHELRQEWSKLKTELLSNVQE